MATFLTLQLLLTLKKNKWRIASILVFSTFLFFSKKKEKRERRWLLMFVDVLPSLCSPTVKGRPCWGKHKLGVDPLHKLFIYLFLNILPGFCFFLSFLSRFVSVSKNIGWNGCVFFVFFARSRLIAGFRFNASVQNHLCAQEVDVSCVENQEFVSLISSCAMEIWKGWAQ